jgi:hypothetical protein
MGFLRRDKGDRPGNGQPPPGAVGVEQTGGADFEAAVADLAGVVVENMNEAPIARETLELLQLGLPHLTQRECSDEAVLAGQTAARLGYLARAAEFAMFEGELEPDDDLMTTLGERFEAAERDGMSSYDAMADLAAAMAGGESLDPPSSEGGPSWTLPGITAQARGSLRDNLLRRMQRPPDVPAEDLGRTWKYGYFLCALDELCED